MRHYPIFMDLAGRRVVVSGAGDTALAKLRLLLKTEAHVTVCGTDPAPEITGFAQAGRLELHPRPLRPCDAMGAALVYGANADPALDARAAAIGRAAGALVNIVDDLSSDFITPAIVDRDPVTVAIGTEGAAPVVARHIKARVEEMLPATLGALVRAGQGFRHRVAAWDSKARRVFWTRFYFGTGPQAQAAGHVPQELERLHGEGPAAQRGVVHLVGSGPGDPELLTLRARRLLHEADVVIHDRLVPQPILELARREALILDVGKTPYGPAWKQADINALIVEHARAGNSVVRLKSGDPGIFGRLDDEARALDAAGIDWHITPGITAASAAAASIGQSLTQRGRNPDLRLLTGHDVDGFAEHDWRALTRPGTCAAVYMGVRASEFLRGRLLMHGADPQTPVTAVENASRPDQRVIEARLIDLPQRLAEAAPRGPVVLLYGLAPRAAAAALSPDLQEAL
ncbi:uroporphyrinogen-III C-methyltransferase [Rhodobacteraceae bacterium 2376]|uniref:Uroporphyrinogen-III C-methyltransferase n=1 Tax=Rhabdonatronobacter sediminivivens TaxID=2743469 RepID=A0A7Z0HXT5_9RHOB|nr:siroheme synthase CysG [Rhabdonatronobacter sediminivivens]NYS24160.1 uroporphyrinogen-III C-methyltransferase [Rhabdonatronobacter sediminivivens]